MGLKNAVLQRIARYEERRLRLRLASFGAAAAGSFCLAVFGMEAVLGDASQSGFSQFASFFFYNFSLARAGLSDLLLSLVESFPVFSSAILLGGVFAITWSVVRLLNEIGFMRERNISLLS